MRLASSRIRFLHRKRRQPPRLQLSTELRPTCSHLVAHHGRRISRAVRLCQHVRAISRRSDHPVHRGASEPRPLTPPTGWSPNRLERTSRRRSLPRDSGAMRSGSGSSPYRRTGSGRLDSCRARIVSWRSCDGRSAGGSASGHAGKLGALASRCDLHLPTLPCRMPATKLSSWRRSSNDRERSRRRSTPR